MAKTPEEASAAGRLGSALDATEQPVWTTSDLIAILDHQLNAPLLADLQQHFPDLAGELRQRCGERASTLRITDILFHEGTLESLQIVKQVAKRATKSAGLPDAIAAILYYACICAAELRYRTKIHSLSNDAFKTGIEWALNQDWLTPDIRALLQTGR